MFSRPPTNLQQASTIFRFTYTSRATEKQHYKRIDTTADRFIDAVMTRDLETGPKDGTGLIGACFKPGSRLEQKNVETVTALILDIDGKFKENGTDVYRSVDADAFLAKIPFRGVAHSSHSATADLSKFRAIFPLEEEITVEEHQRLWHWMFEKVGGMCDPAAKNADRMFYNQRVNAETGFLPWRRELHGPLLNYRRDVPPEYALPKGVVPVAKAIRRPGMHLASRSHMYLVTDGRLVLEEFRKTGLVQWAKDNPGAVTRETWRGIATNIACIVNGHADDENLREDCLAAFHEISCEDVERYNERETDVLFNGALASAISHGPMTAATMLQNGVPKEALPQDARAVVAEARVAASKRSPKRATPAPVKLEPASLPPLQAPIGSLLQVGPAAAPGVATPAPSEAAVQVPHGDQSEGSEGKDPIDDIDPTKELLYDARNNEFLIKDYAGQWIREGLKPANFTTWLIGRGLGRKAHDGFIEKIPQFTQRMPVYEHPTISYLRYEDQDTFNTYVPSTLQPTAGAWDDIKALLMNLVGRDAAAFDFFLQWLAAPVQALCKSPGGNYLKTGTAVVLHGEQGGGKGTLHEIMKLIYGATNVGIIGQGSLDSQFNSEMLGKLFVTANEVMSSTNRGAEAANKLKMWITDAEIPVRGMYQETQLCKNTFNMLFTSNDETPVVVEKSDRRFSVFYSLPLDKALATRIYDDINGPRAQVAAFLQQLLTLPVTIKYGDLFKTDARSAMQTASLHSEIKFVQALRHEGWIALSLPWAEAGNLQPPRMPLLSEDNVAKPTMSAVYQEWCRNQGIRPRATQHLTKALREEFGSLLTEPRVSYAATQVFCWKGLPMQGEDTKIVPISGTKASPPGQTG